MTQAIDTSTLKTDLVNGLVVPGQLFNAQTGTSYTYVTGDRGKFVTHNNASSIAATLPQAGVSFPAGWKFDVKNIGAGLLTITPVTSTIDGVATLTLTTGKSVRIVSDGLNYFTLTGRAIPSAATGGGADAVFVETNQNISTSYTISTGFNAGSFGPVTIATGATVTVPTGATWSIV